MADIINAESTSMEATLHATAPDTAFRLIRDEVRAIRHLRKCRSMTSDDLTERINRIMVLAGGIAG